MRYLFWILYKLKQFSRWGLQQILSIYLSSLGLLGCGLGWRGALIATCKVTTTRSRGEVTKIQELSKESKTPSPQNPKCSITNYISVFFTIIVLIKYWSWSFTPPKACSISASFSSHCHFHSCEDTARAFQPASCIPALYGEWSCTNRHGIEVRLLRWKQRLESWKFNTPHFKPQAWNPSSWEDLFGKSWWSILEFATNFALEITSPSSDWKSAQNV